MYCWFGKCLLDTSCANSQVSFICVYRLVVVICLLLTTTFHSCVGGGGGDRCCFLVVRVYHHVALGQDHVNITYPVSLVHGCLQGSGSFLSFLHSYVNKALSKGNGNLFLCS